MKTSRIVSIAAAGASLVAVPAASAATAAPPLAFGPPVSVPVPAGGYRGVDVATGPDGDALVAFSRSGDGRIVVRDIDGPRGPIGAAQVLPIAGAATPLLNARGDAAVVVRSGDALALRVRRAGSRRWAEVAPPPPGARAFALAPSGSLDAVVVATEPAGGQSVSVARLVGRSWVVTPALTVPGTDVNVTVAIAPGGGAVAAWVGHREGTVTAAVRPAGAAAFEPPVELTPAVPGGHFFPDLDARIAADGGASVAWRGVSAAVPTGFAIRPPGAAAFAAPVAVADVGDQPTTPRVAFAPGGAATAAWADSSGTLRGLDRPAQGGDWTAAPFAGQGGVRWARDAWIDRAGGAVVLAGTDEVSRGSSRAIVSNGTSAPVRSLALGSYSGVPALRPLPGGVLLVEPADDIAGLRTTLRLIGVDRLGPVGLSAPATARRARTVAIRVNLWRPSRVTVGLGARRVTRNLPAGRSSVRLTAPPRAGSYRVTAVARERIGGKRLLRQQSPIRVIR
ncbi:MAG: hypothetical protein AB7V42_09550 [Thermoleophilia bacterium]